MESWQSCNLRNKWWMVLWKSLGWPYPEINRQYKDSRICSVWPVSYMEHDCFRLRTGCFQCKICLPYWYPFHEHLGKYLGKADWPVWPSAGCNWDVLDSRRCIGSWAFLGVLQVWTRDSAHPAEAGCGKSYRISGRLPWHHSVSSDDGCGRYCNRIQDYNQRRLLSAWFRNHSLRKHYLR